MLPVASSHGIMQDNKPHDSTGALGTRGCLY